MEAFCKLEEISIHSEPREKELSVDCSCGDKEFLRGPRPAPSSTGPAGEEDKEVGADRLTEAP